MAISNIENHLTITPQSAVFQVSDVPRNTTDQDFYSLCSVNATDVITHGEASTLTVVVYRGIIPTLCLIGIIGNILNFVVLTSKSWKHLGRLEIFAKTGLVALATADMAVCSSALPWSFIYYKEAAVSTSLSFRIIYTTYSPFLINTFMLSSTLFTVSLAVGRYVAIGWPIQMRARINKTFTRTVTCGVAITSVIINLPHLWKLKLNTCTAGYQLTYYYVTYGFMYEGRPHLIYSCLSFAVTIAIPVIVLAICNFFLIRNIHRSRRHRLQTVRYEKTYRRKQEESQHVMTLVLVIIVLMHILLVTPGGVTHFVSKIFKVDRTSSTHGIIVAVVNVMEICNYTFNFVLYCTLNAHFRLVISRAIRRCCILMRCQKPAARDNGDLNSSVLQEEVTLFSHV